MTSSKFRWDTIPLERAGHINTIKLNHHFSSTLQTCSFGQRDSSARHILFSSHCVQQDTDCSNNSTTILDCGLKLSYTHTTMSKRNQSHEKPMYQAKVMNIFSVVKLPRFKSATE